MELEAIRIFVEIARRGSFSETARALHLSSASVSYKIQKLEQSLNTRLFNRTTRSVKLSGVGEQLYAKAVAMLALETEMVNIAAQQCDQPQGILRVTAPRSLGPLLLNDWIIEFRQLYPGVGIEYVEGNRILDLQQHQLDFAFRISGELLPDSSQISRKLTEVQFGLYAAPQLMSKIGAIDHPDQLAQLPCLNLTGSRNLNWVFQRDGQQVQVQPKSVMGSEDIGLVHKAAVAGVGVGLLQEDMVKTDIAEDRLQPILSEWWPPAHVLYLVYPQKQYLTAKHSKFITFIIEKFI